jgi:N-acetylneuraminic acid mutarotase
MKTTRILAILVLALGLASVCLAEDGLWTRKADMPTGRWELSTCVVDGKIYAIGGAGPVYQALRTVEEYDPATNTWTTKSEMPTARQGLSTNVVNGKIYAIGGGVGSSSSYSSVETFSTVEEYDPATDTWTTKSDMPTARGFHSANVLDGKIYVIGGSSAAPYGGTAILAVEVYDPATDTWTQKGNIPGRRGAGFSSVVDGKIYAFGGYGGLGTVHEYDPVTDTWTRKANMPTRRCGLSTSVLDGKIYAIGGHPGSSPYPGLATVEVYDPATDTWTTAPDMPTGRCGVRTSVVDGKIYAIGGYMGTWLGPMCVTVGEYDLFAPIVDFNSDFMIDIEDLIILIEHWGQDEPSVDIAPPPSGDGIVDVQDLEIFMSYWGREFNDPRLVAYWKLDETEGSIAYDSAGYHDGTLYGEPLWQPAAGAVAGALAFDGTDDYVSTDLVLNPADGPFSVFAWIKEGAPGQVIISQADRTIFGTTISTGSAWLSTDPAEGKLMTELQDPGQTGGPLASQTVVTDGGWHRVGLTWDSSNRILYVDDVEVARDTQPQFGSSRTGLYIGAGNSLEPGSFFSGLIDDVRIYNRAVTP